ncbi:MAG: LPXTG cell wall anchor domain-containing protein, partial [Anaerolineaceae bacterium]|nr:LPXTG cell wall anchor domain-containing protein [Anaerolineaceae bacterium]
ATNFAIAQEQAAIPTQTLVPEDTLEPTATPVVVFDTETPAPSSTVDLTATAEKEIGGPPSGDGADRTATVAALLTQAAGGGTAVATVQGGAATTTALPDTGLADQVGLPLLFGLAFLLIVIAFLVRRFRLSS